MRSMSSSAALMTPSVTACSPAVRPAACQGYACNKGAFTSMDSDGGSSAAQMRLSSTTTCCPAVRLAACQGYACDKGSLCMHATSSPPYPIAARCASLQVSLVLPVRRCALGFCLTLPGREFGAGGVTSLPAACIRNAAKHVFSCMCVHSLHQPVNESVSWLSESFVVRQVQVCTCA